MEIAGDRGADTARLYSFLRNPPARVARRMKKSLTKGVPKDRSEERMTADYTDGTD